MDVLLARDVDLLRLVLEELDVVVDVENVLVEGGEVVQLREGGSRGSASQRAGGVSGRSFPQLGWALLTSFLTVSSSLSTGSSLPRPCRFSCRFSFLLGVYGTKSSSLRRKTTGSSLTQKKITSYSGSRRETTVKHQGKKRKKERGSHFLLGATGNNLLSDRGSAPQRGFGGGPPYNFVNFISIMVSFLAAVSTGMLLFFPAIHTTAIFCLLSPTFQPQPPWST